MKQPKNKFNKCIKRAIKAAYSEREEMEKQRDIWERAINEKDRQIDMLNGMLEVQPLDTLKEAKGDYDATVEEKPFDEVWNEFVKTLSESTIHSVGLMNEGRKWCEDFYNYKEMETCRYTKDAVGYSDIEEHCFIPFLKFIKCDNLLVNGVKYPLLICNNGYLLYGDDWVFFRCDNNTIQRIRPNS